MRWEADLPDPSDRPKLHAAPVGGVLAVVGAHQRCGVEIAGDDVLVVDANESLQVTRDSCLDKGRRVVSGEHQYPADLDTPWTRRPAIFCWISVTTLRGSDFLIRDRTGAVQHGVRTRSWQRLRHGALCGRGLNAIPVLAKSS